MPDVSLLQLLEARRTPAHHHADAAAGEDLPAAARPGDALHVAGIQGDFVLPIDAGDDQVQLVRGVGQGWGSADASQLEWPDLITTKECSTQPIRV